MRIIQVVDPVIDRPVVPFPGRWPSPNFGPMALCIVRPIMVRWEPMQIVISVLVLLRVWILYGRTLKITIAFVAVFIFYLCATIALLAYIFGAIKRKSSRKTEIG